MGKPTEITEASIKNRIKMALAALTVDDVPNEDQIYRDGNFHELVGIVQKATYEERIRASNVCVRHGKGTLASIIRDAKP